MSSKYKRKGRSKFVLIFEFMMKTAAWADLTPNDRATYLEIKRRYDGLNNGRIGCGCREIGEALGISKDTANRSLVRLESHGFIAVAKRGAFSVKMRVATEWRITEYKCDVTGELPTKDFVRWAPEKKTVAPQGQTVAAQGQFAPRLVANHG